MSDEQPEQTVWERLAAPYHPDRIHWRVGSTTRDDARGMALAYVDARDVMNRLDRALGPENWTNEFREIAGRIICRIGVDANANDQWVYKEDGAGDTQFEAEKGGLSDAFKRAAVHFGVGRYLYYLDTPWVEVEKRGKSFVIPRSSKEELKQYLWDRYNAAVPEKPPETERPPPPPPEKPAEKWKEAPAAAPGNLDHEAALLFAHDAPSPPTPRHTKWREYTIDNQKSPMHGKTWGDIEQGPYGGGRYTWLRKVASYDKTGAVTLERTLACIWTIEMEHYAVSKHAEGEQETF